jgi:hypothetical protein
VGKSDRQTDRRLQNRDRRAGRRQPGRTERVAGYTSVYDERSQITSLTRILYAPSSSSINTSISHKLIEMINIYIDNFVRFIS